MKNLYTAFVNRFVRDRLGSVSVEAVLMLPMLLWAYIGMFVYWEAYRIDNTNTKASYMLVDMLSREFNAVDADYIDGLGQVYAYLTENRFPTALRVSSIGWDNDTDDYTLLWSSATHDYPPLTTDLVEQMDAVLPDFPAGDTVILVETILDYTPTFNIGLDPRRMRQFVFSRPRFVSAVPFVGMDGPGGGGSPGGLGTGL